MTTIDEITLEHGYFFSPGFYKTFWINQIEKQFDYKTIKSHVKLKPYREVWLGAIIAAMQTKRTGIPHYVGIPKNEPPDVLVVKFSPVKSKSGNEGLNFDQMPIEITRCSLDDGEDLFQQIVHKNKSAYSDNLLAVYLYGGDKPFDMNVVQNQINNLKVVYPSEILVVGNVETTDTILLPKGTFAQIKLYPEMGQDILNLADTTAFHRSPDVLRIGGRGVSRDLEPLGVLRLKAPSI